MFKEPPNIADLLADRLPENPLKDHLIKVETARAEYLEKLAAAFLVETGLPASEVVLVQKQLPNPNIGWEFYFKRRDS